MLLNSTPLYFLEQSCYIISQSSVTSSVKTVLYSLGNARYRYISANTNMAVGLSEPVGFSQQDVIPRRRLDQQSLRSVPNSIARTPFAVQLVPGIQFIPPSWY